MFACFLVIYFILVGYFAYVDFKENRPKYTNNIIDINRRKPKK